MAGVAYGTLLSSSKARVDYWLADTLDLRGPYGRPEIAEFRVSRERSSSAICDLFIPVQ